MKRGFAASSFQILESSDRPESRVGAAALLDHSELKLFCLTETNKQDTV
jgi:hypothetical protein